jgi:PTH2 family peptidyl-tRNA hydrolase
MGVKQVIILRKDLNMRKGKMVAQGAHAALLAVLQSAVMKQDGTPVSGNSLVVSVDTPLKEWIDGLYKKVCVGVPSEAELLAVYAQAKALNLRCALVQDAGLTEFGGTPTYTAVAIGPAQDSEIDAVTGHLTLL